MTDNRGEVVIYLRGMSPMGAAAWADPPGTPYVPQSLLLAARDALGECYALAGADTDGAEPRMFWHRAARAVADLRRDYDENQDWKTRAERAEAELAECRRNSERWKDYAMHQEWCAECAEGVDSCYDGRALRDAAIDACVGGERG